jgi:hypothetical protein
MGRTIEVTPAGLENQEDISLVPVRQWWRNLGYALKSPKMNKIAIQTPDYHQEFVEELLESEIIPISTQGAIKSPTLVDLTFLDDLYEMDEIQSREFHEADVMLAVYAKLFGVERIGAVRKEVRKRKTKRSSISELRDILSGFNTEFREAKEQLRAEFPVVQLPASMFTMLPNGLRMRAAQNRNPSLYEKVMTTPALWMTENQSDVPYYNPVRKYFRTFEMPSNFFDKFDLSPFIEGTKHTTPPHMRALSHIRGVFTLPGISNNEQLEEYVSIVTGKEQRLRTKKDAEAFITTIVDNTTNMSINHFTVLLNILSTKDVNIPYERLEELATKFKFPHEILRKYKRFSDSYHPNTLSMKVTGIDVKTTLENYLSSTLDSAGFGKETAALAHELTKSNVVCLVDHTNYDGKAFKTGEYKKPGQRALQELITGIMEGNVEGLEDYTVVGFSSTDVFMKAIINYQLKRIPQEFQSFYVEDAIHAFKDIYDVINAAQEYAQKVIFTIDGGSIDDPSAFSLVLDALKRWNVKTLISSSIAMPGVPAVHIQPFTASDLEQRIVSTQDRIATHYKLVVPEDFLRNASARVSMYTNQTQDPLFTAMKVAQKACAAAQARENSEVGNHELSSALSNVFNQTDPGQAAAIESTIVEYPATLKRIIRGQDSSIDDISELVGAHIRGARVGNTPLAIFVPGPTGIGKTLLASVTGKHFSLPWLKLDFSQYTEKADTARLVGSPPGYIGPDEGELSKFARDHTLGIVFVDEYEKASSPVKLMMMNFIDKGTVTAGSGAVYERPGFIIIAASNAGAHGLHRGTSMKDINYLVAKALTDPGETVKEELAARFHIIPMYPVSQNAFVQVIEDSLYELNNLPQFINDSTRVDLVTPQAINRIYDLTEETCRFRYKPASQVGFRISKESVAMGETYYNLREIPRQINRALTRQVNCLHEEAKQRDKDKITKYALDFNQGFVFERL